MVLVLREVAGQEQPLDGGLALRSATGEVPRVVVRGVVAAGPHQVVRVGEQLRGAGPLLARGVLEGLHGAIDPPPRRGALLLFQLRDVLCGRLARGHRGLNLHGRVRLAALVRDAHADQRRDVVPADFQGQIVDAGLQPHGGGEAVRVMGAVAGVFQHLLAVPEQSERAAVSHPQADGAGRAAALLGTHERLQHATDLAVRPQQRAEIHPAVGKGAGHHAPAHRPLFAGVGAARNDGLVQLGFRPELLGETLLAFVVEGAHHQPLVDVAQGGDLLLGARQIPAPGARVGGEPTRVGAYRGGQLGRTLGRKQGLFHVGRIGAIPRAPDGAQGRVGLGAPGPVELLLGLDQLRVERGRERSGVRGHAHEHANQRE